MSGNCPRNGKRLFFGHSGSFLGHSGSFCRHFDCSGHILVFRTVPEPPRWPRRPILWPRVQGTGPQLVTTAYLWPQHSYSGSLSPYKSYRVAPDLPTPAEGCQQPPTPTVAYSKPPSSSCDPCLGALWLRTLPAPPALVLVDPRLHLKVLHSPELPLYCPTYVGT